MKRLIAAALAGLALSGCDLGDTDLVSPCGTQLDAVPAGFSVAPTQPVPLVLNDSLDAYARITTTCDVPLVRRVTWMSIPSQALEFEVLSDTSVRIRARSPGMAEVRSRLSDDPPVVSGFRVNVQGGS